MRPLLSDGLVSYRADRGVDVGDVRVLENGLGDRRLMLGIACIDVSCAASVAATICPVSSLGKKPLGTMAKR